MPIRYVRYVVSRALVSSGVSVSEKSVAKGNENEIA